MDYGLKFSSREICFTSYDSIDSVSALDRRNDYSFFANYSFLDILYSKLRTAYRSRVKLEFHLVFSSFFLSRRGFCVTMISGTEHQKIFVQTRDENIEPEFVPFVF